MADFIDYYSEFDIDRTADCNEIRNLLGNLEADYLNQRAICMTSDEIDVLQKLLDRIDGAIYNLTNEERRKKYDKKLEQMAASGMLTKEQSTAKSDYDQAVLCEKKGKIKDAVMFSERAIHRNIYNQDAYALLIRCYYKLGDYDKAIKIAERKAVRIYPDEPIFRQYCARIRTVGGDYEGSKIHIDEILRRNSNSSEGNIEEAVRLLYMSEDDNFTTVQKNQYLNEAQIKIDSYLSSHSNDNQYRSGVATALVGLTKKYYSRYEGVESLIIDSAHDYNSILSFYQWAHKLSEDPKITEAYEDIINQGKRKFNSDNSRSLMFMSGTALLYLYVFLTMLSSVDTDTETVIAVLLTALFFIVPWFLLIKVSFRPQWKIDKIRYTGHVDLLERIMVAYGELVIVMVKASWEIVKYMFKIGISILSRW